VTDDDQVGLDLARELGDLVHRLPDDHFAACRVPGILEAMQTVGENVAVPLLLLLFGHAVVDGALDHRVGSGRRHDGYEKQLGMAPLRDVAAIEQRLLPRFGTVVG